MTVINSSRTSFLSNRNFFRSGSYFLALNGSLCGLIGNSLFRRALHVTQARFTSLLPMAVLPFVSTVFVYEASISQPLLEGMCLNCIQNITSEMSLTTTFPCGKEKGLVPAGQMQSTHEPTCQLVYKAT